jgi:hypothetical protein
VAAVYAVRHLRLAWYWLAFPPLVEGLLAGNPSIVILALLVSAHPVLAALAAALKVYAVLPLIGEGRRRSVVTAGAVLALSLVAVPLWMRYLSDASARAARLMVEAQGGYGWAGSPALLAMAAVAIAVLARIDRKAAGWLVVPALWPASQFHYSTLAMPVMYPALAMGLAVPALGAPSLTITAYVIWRVLSRRMP